MNHKNKKNTHTKVGRLSAGAALVWAAAMAMPTAQASIVDYNVGYQMYLDFGANKGAFQAGATQIPIYDIHGNVKGTLDLPMADFQAVNTTGGYATLITSQYAVGVGHNNTWKSAGYGNGQNSYQVVNLNSAPGVDFQVARYSKLVTEVTPTEYVTVPKNKDEYAQFVKRYTAFYRTGQGYQLIQTANEQTHWIAGAYQYFTGGTIQTPALSWDGNYLTTNTNSAISGAHGIMSTVIQPGDSGSPLYAYDSVEKKWVLVAVTTSRSNIGFSFATIQGDWINKVQATNSDGTITYDASKGPLTWTYDKASGTGALTQGNSSHAMHGTLNGNLDKGKDLAFSGKGGQIDITQSVDQGAGALTFHDDYTVSSKNGATWVGAGLIVDKGATLTWKVNGVEGDTLHKVGAGTLLVQGVGINKGALKVGDGTTILDQQADRWGQSQAFSSVNIASGRAKVVLMNNKQVVADNISWGYNGGILDINGLDLRFTRLQAADYGAQLANLSDKRTSTVTLDWGKSAAAYSANTWSNTQKGTVGSLYVYQNPYTKRTEYFILKTAGKYGYFPTNGASNSNWQYVGTDLAAAQQATADFHNSKGFLYHGQFVGNLNVVNKVAANNTGATVLDGSANMTGSFTQENGRLTIQGHPVIHAYVSEAIANTIASVTGDKNVMTSPTTFDQKDWETRVFKMGALNLKNTDFGLGRNATLVTTINADHSQVTLGDERVYIDKNDGNGTDYTLQAGRSKATTDADMSAFMGSVNLTNDSKLTINEIFAGSINAQKSQIAVNSQNAVLMGSVLNDTSLEFNKGAKAVLTQGFSSNTQVGGFEADLSLQAMQSATDAVVTPSTYYFAKGLNLEGAQNNLYVGSYAMVSGDISLLGKSALTFGTTGKLKDALSPSETRLLQNFGNYRQLWAGALDAGQSTATLNSTQWVVTGSSEVGSLNASKSLVAFNANKQGTKNFSWEASNKASAQFTTLTADSLASANTDYVFRTDLKNADQLKIKRAATGSNNTVYVNFLAKPTTQDLNVQLISAPSWTRDNVFTAATSSVGFTNLTPVLTTKTTNGTKNWLLTGYKTAANHRAASQAQGVLAQAQEGFLTEVNNLNKRLGELRDNPFGTGAWVRVMNGSGSSDSGFENDYTHLQLGADRRAGYSNLSLYTGATLTYTRTDASSGIYNGQTHSYGAGLYASAVFDSGLYVDVIGKYIRNNTDYNFAIAGTHNGEVNGGSLYAGAEVGYRYQLDQTFFVEPQAEVVWGTLKGQSYAWQQDGKTVSMRQDGSNPLVGRTGVVFGKHFEGNSWKLDARVGANYEFDITKSGAIELADSLSSYRLDGERDARFVYTLGVNAQLGEHVRAGIEVERSAFGSYNIDHAVNANMRYSF